MRSNWTSQGRVQNLTVPCTLFGFGSYVVGLLLASFLGGREHCLARREALLDGDAFTQCAAVVLVAVGAILVVILGVRLGDAALRSRVLGALVTIDEERIPRLLIESGPQSGGNAYSPLLSFVP